MSSHARSELLKVALAVCLAVGSAIAAGLTLGILTLDLLQLHILISCGSTPNASPAKRKQAQQATKILKVRKRGNFLLITLLIVNVATNAGFSILMGDATSGMQLRSASVQLINRTHRLFHLNSCDHTLRGDSATSDLHKVVVSALSSRHVFRYGLVICCRFVPLIILMEIILSPVAWPLAWSLDKILGMFKTTLCVNDYDRDQAKIWALLTHASSWPSFSSIIKKKLRSCKRMKCRFSEAVSSSMASA